MSNHMKLQVIQLMKIGEGEEVLGVVHDDHHLLADRFFTVGGAYESLEVNAKRAIYMGTRLPPKIHERGEGAVKPGRHVFVLKVGTEECIMDLLKRYTKKKSIIRSSR